MMNRRDMAPLLLGGLAVVIVGLLLLLGSGEGGGEGEVPWRESLDPSLRPYWDRLEGRAAPGLDKLEDWMGTEGRGWEDFAGKVVLLDIWGTWCGPCIKALPHMVELHEKYAKLGLVVLGVHSSRGAEHMKGYVQGRKLPYAFAADVGGELSEALGIRYYPSYFVIDQQGVMRVAGAHPFGLDQIIETMLGVQGDREGAGRASE